MDRISMSMLMGMGQNNTKTVIRPSTVKKPREMRQGERFSQTENVIYNMLWSRQDPAVYRNGRETGKEGQTQNFSAGGIGLLTMDALQPMEILQINLFFSESNITVPTIAEVVWADRRPVDGFYRIGLRYLL